MEFKSKLTILTPLSTYSFYSNVMHLLEMSTKQYFQDAAKNLGNFYNESLSREQESYY